MRIDVHKTYKTKCGGTAQIKAVCIDSCNDAFFVVDITDPETGAYSNQALRLDYKRKVLRHNKVSGFDIDLREKKPIYVDGSYRTLSGRDARVLGFTSADTLEVAIKFPNEHWGIFDYDKYGNFKDNHTSSHHELDLEIITV